MLSFVCRRVGCTWRRSNQASGPLSSGHRRRRSWATKYTFSGNPRGGAGPEYESIALQMLTRCPAREKLYHAGLQERCKVTRSDSLTYDQSFYSSIDGWARDSAEQIVPIVVGLLRPRSVVDVGCGTGAWLAAFARHGVEKYLGIDGTHVDRSVLKI